MRAQPCVFGILLVLAAGDAGAAGVVKSMTPPAIEEALALGKAGRPPLYRLATPRVWLQFDTPFLRLARKAGEAQQRQQPVEAALATPDVVAPEVQVTAGPEPIGDSTPGVKAVTIVSPSGAKISPTSSKKVTDFARSKHGKISLHGVSAVFPIAALEPGATFHLQMDSGTDQVFKLEPSWFGESR